MRKILLFLTFLLLISCKKDIVISGVTFTKLTGESDLFYIVQTSLTVDDSALLIKSLPVLELENYYQITFQNSQGRLYAELIKSGDNYLYTKYELPSTGVQKAVASSVIYDGYKCAIISEDFVKSKLKFPLEGKIRTSNHVHEVENGQAIVINKFTAKNAFGVKSEYVYKIWMSFKGGEWEDIKNWSYSKLIIENTATGEQTVF